MTIILTTTRLELETTGGANLLFSSFYHWTTYYMVVFVTFLFRGEKNFNRRPLLDVLET
jgi:hypothetical protein